MPHETAAPTEKPKKKPLRIFQAIKPSLSKQEIFRFVAVNSAIGCLGFHDGSSGALLPYIQRYYSVGYQIVSLLFIGLFVGAISALLLNVKLTAKFGIGIMLPVATFTSAVGFALSAAKLPFPVMCCGFGVIGFGVAIIDAHTKKVPLLLLLQRVLIISSSAYTANLPNVDLKLAILHTVYGAGATVSPLIATAFVTSGRSFNLFYLTSMSYALLNTGLLIAAFKFEPEFAPPVLIDEQSSPAQPVIELASLQSSSSQPAAHDSMANEALKQTEETSAERVVQHHVSFWKVLKVYYVWIGMFFFFLYVGSEVANGGWIVSYLLEDRDAPPAIGYVSAGFFGGLTISRILLVPVTRLLGDRIAVVVYLALALAFEFIVWFVPSIIGGAISISLVGFFFGPIYPIGIAVMTRLLPRSYHIGAIGGMGAFSAVGGAFVPYIVGGLAQKFTITVLQPMEVAMISTMLVIWFIIPRKDKVKRDD